MCAIPVTHPSALSRPHTPYTSSHHHNLFWHFTTISFNYFPSKLSKAALSQEITARFVFSNLQNTFIQVPQTLSGPLSKTRALNLLFLLKYPEFGTDKNTGCLNYVLLEDHVNVCLHTHTSCAFINSCVFLLQRELLQKIKKKEKCITIRWHRDR